MSSSSHQIKIKAVDQTGGVFSSIQKKASVASSKISGMLKGALAAAGAYMGVKAFIAGADELGRLSDVAMKASTSVDELTSATTAFSVLGINADVNSLATAFTKMAQTTGRTGMAGFYKTVEELGKIPDISKRSETTMKVFGRAGIEFLPLINAAKDGTNALQDVIDAMPKIPQAAADAGDKLADAKTIGVAGFKKVWLGVVSDIAEKIDEKFEGGIRQATLNGVAYFEYFIKSINATIVSWFTKLGIMFQGFDNKLLNIVTSFAGALTGSIKAVVNELQSLTQLATDQFAQSIGKKMYEWLNASFGKERANTFKHWLDEAGFSDLIFGRNIEHWRPPKPVKIDYGNPIDDVLAGIIKAYNTNLVDKVDWDAFSAVTVSTEEAMAKFLKELKDALARNMKAVKSLNSATNSSGEDSMESASKNMPNISNKLILGGTADALKLSMLGPSTQSEMKKQSGLLEGIKNNTQKTADNTKDVDNESLYVLEVN